MAYASNTKGSNPSSQTDHIYYLSLQVTFDKSISQMHETDI